MLFGDLAVRLDAHENAERGHDRDDGTSAITHYRQRDADNGQDAGDHAHVHEEIQEEGEAQAPRQQARVRVLGKIGDQHAAPDDNGINRQQQQAAEQAQALRANGEDEGGGGFGQVIEMRLAGVEPALAVDAAGTDSDHGLDGVITGTEWIGLRIEQWEYGAALGVVQVISGEPGGG